MPRVLITGAAGFIGMHTSLHFLNNGWDVIGLDNINNYYSTQLKQDRLSIIKLKSESLNQNFEFYEEDLNSNIWSVFLNKEIDAVIHLAAQAGVRYSIENPNVYLKSNVLGFQKVLDFVLSSTIQKFLYASSSSVYGKNSNQPFTEEEKCDAPESYYAATKRSNELMAYSYAKTHDLSSIGLRFFTVYGPWGRPDMAPMIFADACRKNKKIQVFNYGNQKRDFTYIDDIVEGIYRLTLNDDIEEKALICNIGKGAPCNLMDFINIIEESMDTELEKEFIEGQRGDVEVTFANTKKLQELVDYNPQINLSQGVAKFINWYKKYYNLP